MMGFLNACNNAILGLVSKSYLTKQFVRLWGGVFDGHKKGLLGWRDCWLAYFVFSYRIIQLIMIGNGGQKRQNSPSPIKELKITRGFSIKDSIASTAFSGSAGSSLVIPRQENQPRGEEGKKYGGLVRAASSASVVETAVRVFDQLAKCNKKSHLLKKYAQLKKKYEDIMENSKKKGSPKNRKDGGVNGDENECQIGEGERQYESRVKTALFQSLPEPMNPLRNNYIQFHSQKGVQIFQILKYLSEGASGKVYLVRHIQTGLIFSLKIIPKASIGPLNVHQVTRQLKIQSFLDHPNIVKLYHHHVDHHNIYLLLEPCLGRDLYNTLRVQQDGLPEKAVKDMVRQVCQAVEHMHRRDILHRDIKPENILLHEGVVKICDFGWAVHSPLLRETRCGTPLYASPEMVRAEQYDSKIDVWNIGVLTYELLYGNIPFEIRQLSDLSKIIEQEVYFASRGNVSEYAKEFIAGCLQKHPSKRFTIRQAIEHDFLANLDKYRWTVV